MLTLFVYFGIFCTGTCTVTGTVQKREPESSPNGQIQGAGSADPVVTNAKEVVPYSEIVNLRAFPVLNVFLGDPCISAFNFFVQTFVISNRMYIVKG